MAEFTGTEEDFHKFIGPRIRNAIQAKTKKNKKKIRKCQSCGLETELEAAHVHGKRRKGIIDEILRKHEKNGVVKVDIGKIEKEIMKAHEPLEDYFKFLCKKCHAEYDKRGT